MRTPVLLALLALGCRSPPSTEKHGEVDSSVPEEGGEGEAETHQDTDGDGVFDDSDCDPTNPDVHPGAPETCNDRDDDCDGEIDEDPTDPRTWYADADGDGHGDSATATETCRAPDDHVSRGGDCDDTHPEVFPGAPEQCDTLDRDCDGDPAPAGRFADFIHPDRRLDPIESTADALHLDLDLDGTLQVCPGVHTVELTITADALTVVGHGLDETVLQGDGGTVVTLAQALASVDLVGLTLTGGLSTGLDGAGITTVDAYQVLLTLDDVRITGNHGERAGAGILLSGDLVARGLILDDNHLAFDRGSLDIENSFNCEGGGAYVLGDVLIEDSLIEDNTVLCEATVAGGFPRALGGGLRVYGNLDMFGTTVQNNVVVADVADETGADAAGGGLAVRDHSVIVESFILDNSTHAYADCITGFDCWGAASNGAAFTESGGELVDSLLRGNLVESTGEQVGYGGAITIADWDLACSCTDPAAQDCGIYGNTSGTGGAVWVGTGDRQIATLTSDGCDWDGGQDNDPDDIAGLFSHNAGDDADFFCDKDGCVE